MKLKKQTLLTYFKLIFFVVNLLLTGSIYAKNISPMIWNLPYKQEFFIGREDSLDNLNKLLKNNLVFISGINGIGKTFLAIEYAHKYKKDYDLVWKFSSKVDLSQQYELFADMLYQNGFLEKKIYYPDKNKYIRFINNWLQSTNHKWLLIFDDVSKMNELYNYLPEHHSSDYKHIIVTTNLFFNNGNEMKLEKFERKESLKFLNKNIKVNIEQKSLNLLAEHVGDHPLALKQSAAYFNCVEGVSVTNYIDLLEKQKNSLWEAEKVVLNMKKDDNKAYKTLSQSIQVSLQKLKNKNKHAFDTLMFLSLINFEKIEKSLLADLVNILGDKYSTSVSDLQKFNLLDIVNESTYSIHKYITYVVTNNLSDKDREKMSEIATKLFVEIIDTPASELPKFFSKNTNTLSHLNFLFKNLEYASKKLTILKVRALYYMYYYLRDYDSSFLISDDIILHIDSFLDTKHVIDVARFYGIYSNMKLVSSTPDDAIKQAEKSKKILLKLDSEEAKKELVLILTNNLGNQYFWQGNLSNSQECCDIAEKSLKNLKYTTGEATFLILKLNLAIQKGNFYEAIEISKKLELLFAKDESIYNSMGFYIYTIISKAYGKLNDYKRSMLSADKAYKLALIMVDGDSKHEMVARAGVFLAKAKMLNKRFGESKKLVISAIDSFDNLYKDKKHSLRQAYAHIILGSIYQETGELELAHNHYVFAESIYNKLLTSLKIDDVSELYFKLTQLGFLLKDNVLVKKYCKKHIELFGLNHSRTLSLVDQADKLHFSLL